LTLDTNKPMIWIVDQQQWPRALLRAELLERGYEAIGFEGVNEALDAFRHRLYGRPRVIILELKELEEGEDVCALVELGIPTILLAGAREFERASCRERGRTALLKRPLSIDRVVKEVDRQLEILKEP